VKKLFLGLLTAAVLLAGCQPKPKDTSYTMEEITTTLAASVEDGHFFFAGKVTEVGTNPQMLSYYDAESETNTVYRVEVTDDFLGCMPDDPITVCIYGTKSNFGERVNLEKGQEYLFDTTLWVYGDQVVYLLPTFYQSLPQLQGEGLVYVKNGVQAPVKGTVEDYKEQLYEQITQLNYTPQRVLDKMTALLQEAATRDSAFFAQKKIAVSDEAHLAQTVATAKALLEQAKNATPNWSGILEVLTK